jgi:coenzyme PQQ synthesis protein D (PqqD)
MTELRLQTQLLEWREVDGEVIALEQERSAYVAANRSGALLWRALAEGCTQPELTALLVAEYGIDANTAKVDVDGFLADLAQRGLLAPE